MKKIIEGLSISTFICPFYEPSCSVKPMTTKKRKQNYLFLSYCQQIGQNGPEPKTKLDSWLEIAGVACNGTISLDIDIDYSHKDTGTGRELKQEFCLKYYLSIDRR